jgi:ATP-dependent DNA ligase
MNTCLEGRCSSAPRCAASIKGWRRVSRGFLVASTPQDSRWTGRSVHPGPFAIRLALHRAQIRWTATVKRALPRLGFAKPGPTRFPHPFRPMLAEPGEAPFDGPEWIYEPKWDGIRILAYVQGDRVRLLSRNFQNFTGLFPPVTDSLKSLTVPIVLDGEVVAVDADGLSDFAALQQWLRSGTKGRVSSHRWTSLHWNLCK